jgi:hypothetical protein
MSAAVGTGRGVGRQPWREATYGQGMGGLRQAVEHNNSLWVSLTKHTSTQLLAYTQRWAARTQDCRVDRVGPTSSPLPPAHCPKCVSAIGRSTQGELNYCPPALLPYCAPDTRGTMSRVQCAICVCARRASAARHASAAACACHFCAPVMQPSRRATASRAA